MALMDRGAKLDQPCLHPRVLILSKVFFLIKSAGQGTEPTVDLSNQWENWHRGL